MHKSFLCVDILSTYLNLSCDKFVFHGYLPAKPLARRKYLKTLVLESKTLVFYEAPHRILDLIKEMYLVFGELRHVAIARELTKKHEEIVRDTLSNIKFKIENNEIKNKGEFVVIVEGNKDNLIKDSEILRINKILTETVSSKDAVLLTAKITKRKKNEIYKLVHKNKKLACN